MHDREEQMLVFCDPNQRFAGQGTLDQIERLLGRLFELLLCPAFPFHGWQSGQIYKCKIEFPGWFNELDGTPVNARKSGPQNFVAIDNTFEGILQRTDIQGSGQPEHGGDMIGRAGRLDLVDEPKALLGK
jgi:hypothetical protein